jgi:hypothetical protein
VAVFGALCVLSCGGSGRTHAATVNPAERQAHDPDYVCLPGAPERCGNAWDDDCNGLFDEGCGLNTGLAQFLIAWDAPGADVDLEVIDPRGHLAEAGRLTVTGLIKERDCPGRNDDCKGARLENVYLEAGRSLAPGTYTVRVSLITLRDRDQPARVALSVRLGDHHHAERFTLGHEGAERQFRFAP